MKIKSNGYCIFLLCKKDAENVKCKKKSTAEIYKKKTMQDEICIKISFKQKQIIQILQLIHGV